jgi:hypothetical protein
MNSYIRIDLLIILMVFVVAYFTVAGYVYGKFDVDGDAYPVKILFFILALIWLPILIVTFFIPTSETTSYDDPYRERNYDDHLRQRSSEATGDENDRYA